MAKKSKKGIIIGVVVACAAIGALTPNKDAESTELSAPAYQVEYDMDTEVPVDVPHWYYLQNIPDKEQFVL